MTTVDDVTVARERVRAYLETTFDEGDYVPTAVVRPATGDSPGLVLDLRALLERPQPPTVATREALTALADSWEQLEVTPAGAYPEAIAYAEGRETQAEVCADALRDVLRASAPDPVQLTPGEGVTAAALAGHRYLQAGTINGQPAPGWCSCGDRWFADQDAHDRHVAASLPTVAADTLVDDDTLLGAWAQTFLGCDLTEVPPEFVTSLREQARALAITLAASTAGGC